MGGGGGGVGGHSPFLTSSAGIFRVDYPSFHKTSFDRLLGWTAPLEANFTGF